MPDKQSGRAQKWAEAFREGIDDFDVVTPFVNAKNLAVRHKLTGVSKNKQGEDMYIWDVWTVSDTIAKGAAYRATQRALSSVLFRQDAEVRITDEEKSGVLTSKKTVVVVIKEKDQTGAGWVSSASDTADRWAEAFKEPFE